MWPNPQKTFFVQCSEDHQGSLILCTKLKASLPFPLGLRYRPFWPISFTLILLLSTISRSKKCSFRCWRVTSTLPFSTRSVGYGKITWQFGSVLVMTHLSCSKSLRILRDVLETGLFVPTCKIMTAGFFITRIHDGPFQGCLKMRDQKGSSP